MRRNCMKMNGSFYGLHGLIYMACRNCLDYHTVLDSYRVWDKTLILSYLNIGTCGQVFSSSADDNYENTYLEWIFNIYQCLELSWV